MNGHWIPLGYEFTDVPSDAGGINIQPLGSGYETALRFVVDGQVLASTDEFTVQPPKREKRDEAGSDDESESAIVAPAATSVGESLLLAPTASVVSHQPAATDPAPTAGARLGVPAPAPAAGGPADTAEGAGAGVPAPAAAAGTPVEAESPSDAAEVTAATPGDETAGESLLLAPSANPQSPDTVPAVEAPADTAPTTHIANGPGKAGPAPTPGATIVANGTTLTLRTGTQTVDVPANAGDGTLLHQTRSLTAAEAAKSASGPSDPPAASAKGGNAGHPSSGPLRLIDDGVDVGSSQPGIITPGTLTAVVAPSAEPTLHLANGAEGSLILASSATGASKAGHTGSNNNDGELAVASASRQAGVNAAGAQQHSAAAIFHPSIFTAFAAAAIAALAI